MCSRTSDLPTLSATPGGCRLLGVLRAVASGLALDETVRVLPWLRRATQARDDRHDRLSPSRARDLAYGIGMAGMPAVEGECLDWAGRLRRRRDRLLRDLDAAERAPVAERRRRAIESQAARRWLKDVEPILPGVNALQELAAASITAASVGAVAAALAAFVRRWLRMPAEPPDLLDILGTIAATATHSADAAAATGTGAVRALAAAVQSSPLTLRPCREEQRRPYRIKPPTAGAAFVEVGPGHSAAVPHAGAGEEVLAAGRIRALLAALETDATDALHGFIDADAWATVLPPGLTPQRPLSATAVVAMLACPFRFLIERILFLHEPPGQPPPDLVAPIVYGQLFHTAAERLFAVAGTALCQRDGSVDQWCTVATEQLGVVIEEHFIEQPLPVAGAAAAVRHRLETQMRQLVRYEWTLPPRTFVASESTFGDPEPVALATAGTTLYLRGAVDRLDRLASGGLALRDLKTGRLRPFETEPINPARDLQLGTYVLALEESGALDGERVATAAYVSPTVPEPVERVFVGDHLEELRQKTRQWLSVAGGLLRAGTFPRTVQAAECAVCAFRVFCGDRAWARSAALLAQLPAEHPAARFAGVATCDPQAVAELDANRVPVVGAAWVLRRFLLGLRALADRDDGVAELALLGPPFFAVDLADLVTERAAHGVTVPPVRALRMDAVRAVVDVLRLCRHDQSPGTVARNLIEWSGLGRSVAIGVDAAATRALLDAAADQLDRLALRDGVDFDAVTEPVTVWLAAPDWTAHA